MKVGYIFLIIIILVGISIASWYFFLFKKSSISVPDRTVQFIISEITQYTSGGEGGPDSGGHLVIKNLPSNLTVGRTYTVTLNFSFEWSDWSPQEFRIDAVYIGLVSEKNLKDLGIPELSNALIVSDASRYPGKIDADWNGFDFVAVNKKVKIGESITITAHITPQKVTQSGKAYLMFDMTGQAAGMVNVVKSQIITPTQPVTVNIS